MMIQPPENGEGVEIIRKPTIGQPPLNNPLPEALDGVVVIKTQDKTSTDDIILRIFTHNKILTLLLIYRLTPLSTHQDSFCCS